ncbi:nitrogen fixation protein NifM [Reinekea marinisedimentorum]|uniref:peptidylprolyl isomerase n=1 Tax=Reinekea marinisedimentorum TaxID=230495 RepID=A0A4R3HZN0_9GAMM|nr:nitrogen fixation protein NifM [Reinekea marinisedimentorum]TCS38867.1 peptidyl-prolyl cis-trans isomerase C [Reinekea marinisedimentorum]
MTVAQTLSEYSALKPYLQMKTSLERFGKIASELESAQKEQLKTWVNQQLKLHQKVLTSKEATQVSITSAQISHAIQELESRFASSEDFEVTLEANELDRNSISTALNLELHSETVLDYVSLDFPQFSEEQAKEYYDNNLEKFEQPERRKTSHILITINDEFPENRREAAYRRMQEIALKISPDTFGEFAERHSECPTAMNRGELGLVEKDLLHKELDEFLFTMGEGGLSPILETEAGYHILYCEQIFPAHCIDFEQAKDKIIEKHNQVAKAKKQKQWLSTLLLNEQ